MVSCKHCQTPNSLDSTFCRRCGTAIADAELQEAQAKLEKLIEEGNTLFNQGRIDEALAIAEAATASNPSSTSALSLKVLCHERRGEIAEALECADRLVELNPDSEFDRIRRATLRQKLQTDLQVPAAPDRRLAFVGATAAVVLVLCLGALAAKLSTNSASPNRVAMNDAPVSTQTPNQAPESAPSTQTQSAPETNTARTNPDPNAGLVTKPAPDAVQPLHDNNSASAPVSGNVPAIKLPENTGSSLPDVGPGGDVTVEPFKPNLPDGVTKNPAVPTKGATNPKGNSEDPPMDNHGPVELPKDSKSAEDPGVVQISVHGGGGSRSTAGSEPISGNGLEALLRVGSQQYQMGNYAGAARSYEQAVHAGGDAIILNRRLGQAYERLGRSSDAADAYRRCIIAIDSAIAAGRGNKESLANTRSVCEQALKVLGG